jgi:hypothetical protein
MQFNFRYNWLIARLLVISANIGGMIFIPLDHSNLDWGACFLISFVWSVSLFVWLAAIRNDQNMVLDDTYSWSKPFLPIRRYPLRFWLLVGYSLVLGGSAAMLVAIISHGGREAVGGTFFFVGLFTLLVVIAWIKRLTKDI